jgi:hypothetical protein
MTPERTPDAVRSPLSYAGAGDSLGKLLRLYGEFARVLNVPRVYVRLQGSDHFISGRHDDSLNFPSHDARSGTSRYVWRDRGDGVLYGFLRSDA